MRADSDVWFRLNLFLHSLGMLIMANLLLVTLQWISLLSRAFAGEISDAGIVHSVAHCSGFRDNSDMFSQCAVAKWSP